MLRKRKSHLFLFLIAIPILSLVIGLQARPVTAYETTVSLEWGEAVFFNHSIIEGPGRDIKWSFSGSHSEVGIKVGVMDLTTLNNFYSSFTVDYVVSDGSETSDSGRFHIPQENYWYIAFYVIDLDGMFFSTTVDIKADYVDSINLGLILGLSIGLPLGLVAITLPIIIFTVIVPRRRKKKLGLTQESNDKLSEISKDKDEIIFCWKCGSENPTNNKYCGQCSVELVTKK
jgi:hypothetical protein